VPKAMAIEGGALRRRAAGTRDYDWDYFWWRPCVPSCRCMTTHGDLASERRQRLLRSKRQTEGWLQRETELVCLRCPNPVICLRDFYEALGAHRPAIASLGWGDAAPPTLHLVLPRLCSPCAVQCLGWLEEDSTADRMHELIQICIDTWRPGPHNLRHEGKAFERLQRALLDRVPPVGRTLADARPTAGLSHARQEAPQYSQD
jgi:hypothetical protein